LASFIVFWANARAGRKKRMARSFFIWSVLPETARRKKRLRDRPPPTGRTSLKTPPRCRSVAGRRPLSRRRDKPPPSAISPEGRSRLSHWSDESIQHSSKDKPVPLRWKKGKGSACCRESKPSCPAIRHRRGRRYRGHPRF